MFLEPEYLATTNDVVIVDRSEAGRCKVSGSDGLDLLNRLSTNNLLELTRVGMAMPTVLTTNKGRIIDRLIVVRMDQHLLVITGLRNQERVIEWIDQYTFLEEVIVEDVTRDIGMLGVVGPKSDELLCQIIGVEVSSAPYATATVCIADIQVVVVRTDFAGLQGYDLLVDSLDFSRLWNILRDAGATPISEKTLDVVRIERCVPLLGSELTDKVNPLEANLLDDISFNKGCYIGQEVVARLDTYNKVQRRLVVLYWNETNGSLPSKDLSMAGEKVGEITSAVQSPRSEGKMVALAFVKIAYAIEGVELRIGTDERGTVARVGLAL